jgi:hypothetical protein
VIARKLTSAGGDN